MSSSNTRKWDVLGLGTVVVDHLVVLPRALEPDMKHEVDDHCRQVGGPVPTALVALQRWGFETSFVGGWGHDPHGQLIDKDLRSESINTDYALRNEKGDSGFAHVWIEPGNATRTIAFHRSTGHWENFHAGSIPWSDVRLLHLDGWPSEPAVQAAKEARRRGCMISLDTGSVKDSLDELLPLIDILNCTRRFLRQFLGTDDPHAAFPRLHEHGPTRITVTDGKRGAWMSTENTILHQPAYPVEAVDTTGAGDTFAGGILFGSLNQWSPEKTLRAACAAAALKCRRMGNRDALPSLSEMLELADA